MKKTLIILPIVSNIILFLRVILIEYNEDLYKLRISDIIIWLIITLCSYFIFSKGEKEKHFSSLFNDINRLESHNHNLIKENNQYQRLINMYMKDLSKNNKKELNEKYNFIDVNTGLIALNSLLNSKYFIAKSYNININYNIIDKLDSKSNIKTSDICSIIGNLLDNAIYYNKDYEQKNINLYIENKENLKIIVENSVGYISSSVISKIFCKGFTTKGQDGDGMGLYIVKSIVDSYKGTVRLSNENNFLKFIIELPLKN
ncbi:sensor histidine kinase [Clostridium massiliamazoniense]|uniref:sensor histidine kinase n=1 Tax=Clostridium massiliamazoniense TaxID=1347366 RepID=UPI0006D823C5|nr:GHKL domain-containing protein [Clostridium massiliamazoniense]